MKLRTILLAGLAAVLMAPSLAPALDIRGTINTGAARVYVDTITIYIAGRGREYDCGIWGGDVGVVDTAYFPGVAAWPEHIDVQWRLFGNNQMPMGIPSPTEGRWYTFPGTDAQVMFETYQPGVEELPGPMIPGFGLTASPNPFRARTSLTCHLTPNSAARLAVLDVSGRVVRSRTVVADEDGVARLELEGMTEGVYLARMEAEGFTTTEKLVAR